jgi:predicted nucleic acid-binding protein
MPTQLRYWDSDAFLGWLKEEPDKIDDCRGVIRAAEKGGLRLVTSSLTLTEVIKLKGKPSLPKDKDEAIRVFFKHDWIIVRQLDRTTAEYARGLVWDYGLDPKDSIHVATAILSRVPCLDTFDGKLIKRTGQIGNPPLLIARPNLPEQLTLDDEIGDES